MPTYQIILSVVGIAGAIFGYVTYEASRLNKLDLDERTAEEQKSAHG